MSLTLREPILILSDLHLGHRASLIRDPEQLFSLLRGPGSVIFNGDTAEMRTPEDRLVGRKLAAELARVCHHAGRKAFFINGNHDPTVSGTNHLDLLGGSVLVTHGDILFLGVAPWSRDAHHYLRKHRQILDGLGPDAYSDFEERLLATKRTSIELQMIERPLTGGGAPVFRHVVGQIWPPWRPFMIAKAWYDLPRLALDLVLAFRPDARFIIVGHTHYPGVWQLEQRVIINTGGFVPYFGALAVIIESGRLEVREVKLLNRQFAFGKLRRSFGLQSTPTLTEI
jgi:predicted phosphodiesterase